MGVNPTRNLELENNYAMTEMQDSQDEIAKHDRDCPCQGCELYWSGVFDDGIDDDYSTIPDCEVCGGEFWDGGTSCTCD
jgi:hypothetical protein